eukprot:1606581-Prymnesium_polylepis.1
MPPPAPRPVPVPASAPAGPTAAEKAAVKSGVDGWRDGDGWEVLTRGQRHALLTHHEMCKCKVGWPLSVVDGRLLEVPEMLVPS